MNQIEENNKRHYEAMKVAEDFVKNGGKITELGVVVARPDTRKIPKPKRHIMPSGEVLANGNS